MQHKATAAFFGGSVTKTTNQEVPLAAAVGIASAALVAAVAVAAVAEKLW